MEEEEAAVVVSSRKRQGKRVFLGVFPPRKGECSCGKRTRGKVSWVGRVASHE
jgi:hypothetical protein